MRTSPGINRPKLDAMREREQAIFMSRTKKSQQLVNRASTHLPGSVPMAWMRGLYRTPPIFVDHGTGPIFVDVDGNEYLDFNVCDLSMTMGYGARSISDAVCTQMRKGAHYLLPTEAAIDVAEDLAARTGVPYWQFTLSASGANTEVIRIARFITGRRKIVVFSGKYHGHIDETLVDSQSGNTKPALLGIPAEAAANTIIVPFNSLSALEEALATEEVALVLTEPALTNCNVILPQEGYLRGVRELTTRYGAMLCYDEAHTFQFAFGGLVGDWQLDTDFVVLGKGLGSGISFALYGMSSSIAEVCEKHLDSDVGPAGLATGGTTYATAVAVAAAKASLNEVLTRNNYESVCRLGQRLADGLDRIFAEKGLPWTAFRLGPRSGYCLSDSLPENYDDAVQSLDDDWIDTRRLYMANRGLWDAVLSAGPQASFAHKESDVDRYLRAAKDYIDEVVA